MIVPTARTAWLAALSAPVALVIAASAPGAWPVAPAAALALLALVLVDGALAGRMAEWRVVARPDTEVGEPLVLRVLADLAGRAPGGAWTRRAGPRTD